MHRLPTLLTGCLVAICLIAVGCASQPVAPASATLGFSPATAHVDAGPPACDAIQERIHGSEARYASKAGTWLDAPNRMVESRRLHALHARAADLGCALPQI